MSNDFKTLSLCKITLAPNIVKIMKIPFTFITMNQNSVPKFLINLKIRASLVDVIINRIISSFTHPLAKNILKQITIKS